MKNHLDRLQKGMLIIREKLPNTTFVTCDLFQEKDKLKTNFVCVNHHRSFVIISTVDTTKEAWNRGGNTLFEPRKK